MRATLDRQAQVLWAQALQTPVPQAPQMVPPIHQPLPPSRGQPATPYKQALQPPSKPTVWESPSTPLLTKLLPLAVRTLMATGDRELKAKMITASLPVAPGESERGPLLERPVSRCLTRWVSTPQGHLTLSPQPQHLKVPHPNVVVV